MAARIRIHALATYGTLLTLTWSIDLAQLLGKVTWKECQVQTSAVAGVQVTVVQHTLCITILSHTSAT